MRSLETIRAKISEQVAEYQRVRRARPSEREATARARREIATRRADAEREIAAVVGRWTAPDVDIAGLGALLPLNDPLDAWLIFDFERVEKRILAAITDHYQQEPGGLPAEKRAARLDEIARELLALVVEEESTCRRLDANGQGVLRRADAPVAVVVARDLDAVTVAAVRDELDAP